MRNANVAMMAGLALWAFPGIAAPVRVDASLSDASGDDTRALQSAIDSGAEEVVVPAREKPWIVLPVKGRSNLKLTFEKGAVVEAKKGAFKGKNDCLFLFDCCTNVTVSGYGATLRMHKSDYHAPPYQKSEWRHALSFLSCVNVTVEGLSILKSGGDGVYLGVNKVRDPLQANFRVVIKDVLCDGNNRQGISVISAEDLLVENCRLHRTGGASPEAGIDFEPNNSCQRLVNCRMKNCQMFNNMGSGVEFWLTKFDSSSHPVSILVENCVTECNNEEIRFRDCTKTFGERTSAPRGTVTLRGCTFKNMRNEYIYAAHETDRGVTLRIENCSFVDEPNPPRLAIGDVVECIDDAPGAMKDLPVLMQTGWIGYAVYVDRPRTVTLKVSMTKTNPPPMKNGKPIKISNVATSFDFVGADGKTAATAELLPPDGNGEMIWRVNLPSRGIYAFGGFANRGFYVKASDAPVALDFTKRGHSFHKASCDLYAYAPEGVEKMVVTATAKSRKERMSLRVFDPEGELRNSRTWIESCERYLYRNPSQGWWRFELRRSVIGDFKGCVFDVVGAQGYLFLDKGRMWR
jgi:hypothetical protein